MFTLLSILIKLKKMLTKEHILILIQILLYILKNHKFIDNIKDLLDFEENGK